MDRDDALIAAGSPDWARRADAGSALARAGVPDDEELLLTLLLDENLAVSDATAMALLQRADEFGMRLFVLAAVRADDQTGDELLARLEPVWKGEMVPVQELLRALAFGEDPEAAQGARDVLVWLEPGRP
jgi:HEAT repeat protein